MNDIIVITGGTSGLGLELVKGALKRGYFVCNLARNAKKMQNLAAEFTENYRGFIGDVSDENFVKSAIDEIKGLGNIAVLINCAEKGCFKKPAEYTSSDIDSSLAGLKGMILCTTAVLQAKNEEDVKIVNLMSTAALKGNKNESLYCGVKWGERGFTEGLKAEYKGTSVKVFGVYPGGMNTNFWQESRDYVPEEKSDTFMNPSEVAKVILDNTLNYDGLNIGDIVIERK